MKTIEFMLQELWKKAVTLEVTDIHFLPIGQHIKVYFRANGIRTEEAHYTPKDYSKILSHLKFLSGMDIGETRKPQNGVLSIQINQMPYSLRLSTLPAAPTESLAIRLLPLRSKSSLLDLFLFPTQILKILRWIENPSGLILLTGPTGSGKTTTLYALMEYLIQNHTYQMITLEDPVEKIVDNAIQVQVNENAGITYQTGLKAALRHDPDILMVGEIRDRETAKFAVQAAYTGHLVLTTLHAKNTFGAIFRMEDLGVSSNDLSQVLVAIASQQLITLTPKNSLETDPLQKRVAILEMLDGPVLERAIQGHSPYLLPYFHSFYHIRRKAYALGFINESQL
ncbi:competence type IV pilus ATPase ComGA [Bacillaceae bacterium S4-13-58]